MSPQPVSRPEIRFQGLVPYAETLAAMQAFTDRRSPETPDEIWFLEHPPVYTLGLGARPEHVLDPGETPVVRTDRGGQVTWHGPGQLVAYVLLDLRRRRLGIRSLVSALEGAVIGFLSELGIEGARRPGAPGVYVDGAKIAALGLRVRRNSSYHGLALNVAPDLAAFRGINPCGYPGMPVTSLEKLGVKMDCDEAARRLLPHLLREIGAESPLGQAEAPSRMEAIA
jgi:lipoyl(octanoyl) transferase